MTAKSTFIVGLDLGQAEDFSALVVLERCRMQLTARMLHPRKAATWGEYGYALRWLKRWPLGTSYVAIVAELKELLIRPSPGPQLHRPDDNRPPRPMLHGCLLGVDATGVGRAVVDIVRNANLAAQLMPVTITGGHEANGLNVPKKQLVSVLQMLLQTRRLKWPPQLEHADTLARELGNFKMRVNAKLNEEFLADWRTGQHDDMVLAVAIACYLGERYASQSDLKQLPRVATEMGKGVPATSTPGALEQQWAQDLMRGLESGGAPLLGGQR